MRERISIGLFMGLLCASMAAQSQTFEVKGEGVRFQPEIVFVRTGDVIAFRKMIPHAAESIDGMWPQGAVPLNIQMGAEGEYRVSEEGVYVFRCPKHWGARMVGAIVVEGTEDIPGTIADYLKLADSEALKPAKRLLKRLAILQEKRGGTP